MSNKTLTRWKENDKIPITEEFLFDREQLSKSQDKYILYNNGERVSYFWFLTQLSVNDALRQSFIDTLNASRFETFRYESPPVSSTLKDNDFEFILLDSPHLKGIKADIYTFAEHFDVAETKGNRRFNHEWVYCMKIIKTPLKVKFMPSFWIWVVHRH